MLFKLHSSRTNPLQESPRTKRSNKNWLIALGITLLMPGMSQAEEPTWQLGISNGLREIAHEPNEPARYPMAKSDPAPIKPTSIKDAKVQPVAEGRYGSLNPSINNKFEALREVPITPGKQSPKPIKQANEFQTRLTALEIAVSTVVAEQPNLWRFEPLEAEATQLLLLSSNEEDREAVRQLAQRLDHFASIADRYREKRGDLAANDRAVQTPVRQSLRNEIGLHSQPSPRQEPTSISSAKLDIASSQTTPSQYDAMGVLRPVVSKRPNAPKFALVDDQGRLTTFVTPSEGVDLEPLIGKRLGVRGNRGFIPEYQREHVTAERVATLDRVIR